MLRRATVSPTHLRRLGDCAEHHQIADGPLLPSPVSALRPDRRPSITRIRWSLAAETTARALDKRLTHTVSGWISVLPQDKGGVVLGRTDHITSARRSPRRWPKRQSHRHIDTLWNWREARTNLMLGNKNVCWRDEIVGPRGTISQVGRH